MTSRRFKMSVATLALLAGSAGFVLAQNDDEQEKSAFIHFVEEQLSAPNRRISLNGIEGTLSSDVRFASITIADENGVWLTIENPHLTWSRTALLTGTLDIRSLTAEKIDWPRMPAPDDSLPSPESSGFRLPELPVAVEIGEIAINAAHFGEPVFGLDSTLSVAGRLSLADGTLATRMDVSRTDGPGGSLALDAGYSTASTRLDLDLSLQEPADGVVANLLDIPDRPPVALTLSGSGPMNNLGMDLSFDVGGDRIATGTFRLDDSLLSKDRRAALRLSGPIGSILPPQHRAFFGAQTSVEADMLLRDGGGMDLQRLQVDSGALDVTASATTLDDWFPSRITADVALHSRDGDPVRLPVSGDPVTVGGATFALRYGTNDPAGWTLSGNIDALHARNIDIGGFDLAGSGAIAERDTPAKRAVSFNIDGTATGVRPKDPGIAKATGDTIRLALAGDWRANGPTRLNNATIISHAARVDAKGELDGFAFKGNTRIEAADLAAFSLLANRALAGSASLAANGEVALVGGGFDLSLDGSLTDAHLGDAVLDRLLAGKTQLSGGIARSTDGLSFHALNIANDQAKMEFDGTYASVQADLRVNGELIDIAVLDKRSSGRLTLRANADKPAGADKAAPLDVGASVRLDGARLIAHLVPSAELAFDGKIAGSDLAGSVTGSGFIDGEAIDIASTLERTGDRVSLTGLAARVGLSTIRGDLAVTGGLADGELTIESNDISALAALAFADASGAVNGKIVLSGADNRQDAGIDLSARKLRIETMRAGSADIAATVRDLFGNVAVDARGAGKALEVAGVVADTMEITAATKGGATNFETSAVLANGTKLRVDGDLRPVGDGFDARIETLTAQSQYGNVRLNAPASVSRSGGVTRIGDFDADVAGGRVTASGTIGDAISLTAKLSGLPLSVVNGIRPDLGLGGRLDGTLAVSGPSANPRAEFTLRGAGLDAAALRSASIAPIDAQASGTYGDGAVRLASLSARNGQGLDFSGSGTIPLSGAGLSLRVNGTAPLGIGERFLADRGTRLDGTLRIDATISGSASAPNAEGLFSITGGSVSDPLSNLRLTRIGGVAGLRGDTISISQFTGQLAGGGSISIGGTIGLAGGLPADLRIALRNAVYADGETIRSTMSGDLVLAGPLTGGPSLSGQIDLSKTEITIPETLSGDANLLDVTHVDPDSGTIRTLRRLQTVLPKDTGSGPQAPIRVDITVNSPNRIFVRGRGIDAELGGRVQVTGPLDAIQPVGSFNLIRGRLSILSKRIDLTEGRISLTGSLDPYIDLTAQVAGEDIVAYIKLSGRASDLSLDLSSSPELPSDEILAQILFGKGISSLSPLQLANLATAAASLATGGGGGGLSETIRQGIGVDDLDITQDSEGNAAVRAGKYIQDNVYLDVQAGANSGEVSINLDITDSLTARGSVDTESNSKLGIFFEKDY